MGRERFRQYIWRGILALQVVHVIVCKRILRLRDVTPPRAGTAVHGVIVVQVVQGMGSTGGTGYGQLRWYMVEQVQGGV